MHRFIYWCMVFAVVAGAMMAGVELATSLVQFITSLVELSTAVAKFVNTI